MSKEKPTTKVCKHCKTEIPYGAKVCPQCRKKQGPGGCLIAIIVVIALGLFGSCFGGKSSENTGEKTTKQVTETAKGDTPTTEAPTTEAPIEYTAYSVDDLMTELKSNALKADEKYNKQNVEITGRLGVIDSSGKYISLYAIDDAYAFTGVQCYIKNDDQKSKVMEMAKDDHVTLRGKITAVGEIMGYSLDITEID